MPLASALRLAALGLVLGGLAGCSRDVGTWAAMARDPDPFVRRMGVAGLGHASHVDADVAVPPVLLAVLQDPDPDVRATAAVSLDRIGRFRIRAVTLALTDEENRLPRCPPLAELLVDLGPLAVDDLDAVLRTDRSSRRAFLAQILGEIRGEGVERLVALLEEGDPDGRRCAALGLARTGAEGTAALPALERALADEDAALRAAAALAIDAIRAAG